MQRAGKPGDGPQYLLVGLGNPGPRYAATRHNAGWWVLDELARRNSAGGGFSRHQCQVQQCEVGRAKVLLIRPQSYMNLSGEAVAAWRKEHPAIPWVLVYDDTSFPPGTIRLKRNGGAGGHNGVQSVIERLRTQDFDRLKVGIGPPPHPGGLADYVLAPPNPAEAPLLEAAVTQAAATLELLVSQGFDKAAQFASGGEAKQAERRRQRAEMAARDAGLDAEAQAPSRPEAGPNK